MAASVISASENQLTVLVPANATQSSIVVEANGLIAETLAPFVVTYIGSGSFSTSSFAEGFDVPTGSGSIGVEIIDIDGDGHSDLLTANYDDNTIAIYRNFGANGSLSPASFAAPVTFAVGLHPRQIAIGDIDGDGIRDLVVASSGDSTVSVFKNLSTPGTISLSSPVDFATGPNPHHPVLVDLNGDGRLDLAVGTTAGTALSILRNTTVNGIIASNSFAAKVDFSASTLSRWVSAGDVDGDGKIDLAVCNDGADSISLFRNTTPTGSAAISFDPKVDFATRPRPFGLSIGDLDGDDKADVAVANYSGTISVFQNTSTAGALTTNSLGDRIDFSSHSSAVAVSIVDIDGDGKSDLVALNEYDYYSAYVSTISVFGNVSTNALLSADSFAPRIDFFTSKEPGGLAIGDLDGDGRPEIVVSKPNVLTILRNVNTPAPPAIVVQPTNRILAVGTNVSVSVSATGTPSLAYQWFFNDTPLVDGGNVSGATSKILSIANAQTNDTGNYFVVITNDFGSITSVVATLDVGFLPKINSMSTSKTNLTGSTVAFTVSAEGTAPLHYHWRFKNVNLFDSARINGATNSVLTISNLVTGDAGNYEVIVTNAFGSVTSVVATLTVVQPPTFMTQPIGRSVVPTLPTTFNALATSSYPISYQWQLDGANISGATNTTYEIPAVDANDLGLYRLVASNELGIATSEAAELTYGSVVAWGQNFNGECLPPPGLSNVFAVAGGSSSSIAVRTDGSVVAWGAGSGTNVPVGATNVVAISSSGGTVALRADGSIVGWYFYSYQVPALTNIIAVAAGYSHGLALRSDGKVQAWGNSQLTNVPPELNHVVKIACGANHSLALRSDGTVAAWGAGGGIRTQTDMMNITNVPPGLTNVVEIAAGYSHSLALKSDGTLVAWGIGRGTNIPPGLTNIVAISTGFFPQGQTVNLALRSDGTVTAWGDNGYGETNTPSALSNLVSVAIAGAPYHSLAIVGDGKPLITEQPVGGSSFIGRDFTLRAHTAGNTPLTYQWRFEGVDIPDATNATLVLTNLTLARDGEYQLVASNALGTATSIPVPVTVLDEPVLTLLSQPPSIQTNYQGAKVLLTASVAGNGPLSYQWRFNGTNILAGTNETLALDPILLKDEGVYTLNISNATDAISTSNSFQDVEMVRTWSSSYAPEPKPPGLTNIVAIAAGDSHFLALRDTGKIVGWGSREFNESVVPAALSNAFVSAIAASRFGGLALKSDGTVFAWGDNHYGQTNVPASAMNVTAIASAGYVNMALRADGTVVVWGQNGYGMTNVPTTVSNVVAIATGGTHCLALRSDGTVMSWGNYFYGLPNVPPAATNVIAIAAGSSHSLALRADGTIVAWGDNQYYGQTNVPSGLNDAVAISASGFHSAALRVDGTVVDWGKYYAKGALTPATSPADIAAVTQISCGYYGGAALLGTRAPAITIQPFNRSVFKGSNTLFCAKASAAQPASYQWQFNNADIPGATNDTLALTNLQFSQSGAYQLVVSNRYGVAVSKAGKLIVTLPLGESLDATNVKDFNWTSTGGAQWFGQAAVTHDGVDAARSGDIGNNQETILQTTSIPGQIRFWWKVSSETGFDKLEFLINGVVQASISGEVDWQQRTFSIPPGLPLLQWRYSKDSSGSAGQDSAWVDQVAVLPNPPVITTQPVSKTVEMGTNVTFFVGVSGTGPVGFQWRKNETNLSGGNGSSLILNNVGRAQRGIYSVIVSNAGGSVTSSNAVLNVLVPQQLSAPTLMPDGTFQFSSTDADGGLLSAADLANLELQASDDLTNWVALPNGLSLTNGTLLLKDVEQTNFPARFYRIVEH